MIAAWSGRQKRSTIAQDNDRDYPLVSIIVIAYNMGRTIGRCPAALFKLEDFASQSLERRA